jgi:hypothetical protein
MMGERRVVRTFELEGAPYVYYDAGNGLQFLGTYMKTAIKYYGFRGGNLSPETPEF